MAEEIEITNVGDGGVASEATLKALVKAVQQMAAKSGMDPKKEGAKIQETYNKVQKEGVEVSKKYREELEENTEAVEKSTDAFEASRSMLGLVGNALGSLIGSAAGLFGEFVSGGNRLSDFAQHIPIVGGYLGDITGYLDESMDAFRMVSAVGAGMGNSMMDVRIAAGQAAMPLMDFASFLQQNNIALQALGGGATAGARTFAALSKELREGAGADLLNLGFTIEDLNEGLADFATIQSREIGRERVNRNELINDTVTYLTELDKLSRLTGLSRKQMQEEMAANSRDIRVRTARARMTSDQQIAFDANLAAAGAQSAKLGEVLRDMADGRPDEALTRRLFSQSATFRQFAGEIENMSPDQMQQFMVDVNREIEAFATSMGTGVEALDGPFQEMFGLSADLSTLASMTKEEREKALAEANRRDAVTKAMADFESQIAKVRLVITESLIQSGIFDNMAELFEDFKDALSSPQMQGAIKYFVDMVTKFGNKFINFLKELPEDPAEAFGELAEGIMGLLGDAMSGIGALLGKAFLSALTSPAFIAAAGTAIIAYFGAMKLKDAILGSFGGGGGGSRGSRGSVGAENTMGGSLGKNLGGFIGGLGEGIMKGFAAGLSAFANPKILLGAGIFSGAILAIGAALAGATWLMGKALPSLSEGLEGFEKIDGSNLINVGLGMAALGAGIAAFGAGSVIGAIGNLISGGLEALGNLFGVDSPMEKMAKTAEAYAAIDGRAVSQGAIGVAYMAEAMSAFNSANFGGIKTSIAGFLGFDAGEMAEQVKTIADMFEEINGRQLASASIGVGYLAEALSIFNEGSFNNLGSIMRNWIFDPTDFATNIVVIAKLFEDIQGRQLAQASIGVGYLAEAMEIFNEGSFNNLRSIVRQFLFDPKPFGETIVEIAKLFETIQGRQLAQASIGVGYMVEALEIFNEGNFMNLKTKASHFLFDPAPMGTTIKKLAEDFETIGGRNLAQASIGVAYMAEALEIFTTATGFKGMQTILNYLTPDSTKIGERIKSIAENLAGVDGQMLANVSPGIIAISDALTVFGSGNFGSAMDSIGDTLLNWFGVGDDSNIADRIADMAITLSTIDSEALTSSAEGVSSLTSNLSAMKDLLDTDGVISYNEALLSLVDTLERMNEELAKDNDGLFKERMSAGEALGQIGQTNASSANGINELNNTMRRVLEVLESSKTHHEHIDRQTKGIGGNLQRGGVIPV